MARSCVLALIVLFTSEAWSQFHHPVITDQTLNLGIASLLAFYFLPFKDYTDLAATTASGNKRRRQDTGLMSVMQKKEGAPLNICVTREKNQYTETICHLCPDVSSYPVQNVDIWVMPLLRRTDSPSYAPLNSDYDLSDPYSPGASSDSSSSSLPGFETTSAFPPSDGVPMDDSDFDGQASGPSGPLSPVGRQVANSIFMLRYAAQSLGTGGLEELCQMADQQNHLLTHTRLRQLREGAPRLAHLREIIIALINLEESANLSHSQKTVLESEYHNNFAHDEALFRLTAMAQHLQVPVIRRWFYLRNKLHQQMNDLHWECSLQDLKDSVRESIGPIFQF